MIRPGSGRRPGVAAAAAALALLASLGSTASPARPVSADAVTISLLANSLYEPGWQVLIPNFERAYPNITVEATYAPSSTVVYQIETTELAGGNAPDLLATTPGCGQPISICELAKAGDLAPMIGVPWAKRSLPLVTSFDKYGQGLFAFEPTVSTEGIFINNDLFARLGLKVPETFSQLLDLCGKANADGTVAVLLSGSSAGNGISFLLADLAVPTVYGPDKAWTSELKAGKTSFDGTAGWRQALQEFVDMDTAGCFQPGVAGTSSAVQLAEFAQGQGLMAPAISAQKGTIDAADPKFSYTFAPFPGGATASDTRTFLNLGNSVSVNEHASGQARAAAQTFVDFVARPKQDALFAQLTGGLTQYEFLKAQIPPFLSALAGAFAHGEYVVNPTQTWWNPGVLSAMVQDGTGLITGQLSVDDVLNAMDAAWKQGPS